MKPAKYQSKSRRWIGPISSTVSTAASAARRSGSPWPRSRSAEIFGHLLAEEIQGDRLSAIVDLAFTYPEFAIALKRAHDRNLPLWLLIAFFGASALLDLLTVLELTGTEDEPSILSLAIALPFTVLGLALLVELGFRKGTTGPNQIRARSAGAGLATAADLTALHRTITTAAMTADPIAIARDLVRCRSVTPEEGGALSFLQGLLAQAGFTVHRAVFAEPGTAPVDNLYARIGLAKPNLVFAGHTDVVPPGNEASWSHPPFAGEVAGDTLYGRGAVDMKGGIAAFVAAALDYLAANGGKPKGSISLLITGDEESIAVNGTVKLLQWAAERGETFDHCILGEPSNVEVLGDTIKAGRRGSLNGTLIVTGRQGHVAYPDRADNPIRGLVTLIAALQAPLDEGSEHFAPSNLEFTSVDVGNPTVNLIPGEARARFNIRYNDRHSQAALKALIERRAQTAAAGRVHYCLRMAAVERRCVCHQARPVHRSRRRGDRRSHRPQAETLDQRRHIRRALHQGLLPGARIRPGRPDHAPGR